MYSIKINAICHFFRYCNFNNKAYTYTKQIIPNIEAYSSLRDQHSCRKRPMALTAALSKLNKNSELYESISGTNPISLLMVGIDFAKRAFPTHKQKLFVKRRHIQEGISLLS